MRCLRSREGLCLGLAALGILLAASGAIAEEKPAKCECTPELTTQSYDEAPAPDDCGGFFHCEHVGDVKPSEGAEGRSTADSWTTYHHNAASHGHIDCRDGAAKLAVVFTKPQNETFAGDNRRKGAIAIRWSGVIAATFIGFAPPDICHCAGDNPYLIAEAWAKVTIESEDTTCVAQKFDWGIIAWKRVEGPCDSLSASSSPGPMTYDVGYRCNCTERAKLPQLAVELLHKVKINCMKVHDTNNEIGIRHTRESVTCKVVKP